MIKKPGPAKKSKQTKTKAEKDHLNWVASNPCCVCGNFIVQVHHVRISGGPRNHFKTIPLCYNHHLGPEGIHHLGKYPWREKYGDEVLMLEKLMENK